MLKKQGLKYFEEIFRSHHSDLCRHVARIVQDMDAAEDIVQDVFISYWDKSKGTVIENPHAYLYRACINKALNYVSSTTRRAEINNDAFLPDQSAKTRSPEQEMEFRELEKQVQALIETLPPMCKKVFLLSRYEEMSHKEIAAFLDISPNTVDNHIKKALAILRKIVLHLPLLLHIINQFC